MERIKPGSFELNEEMLDILSSKFSPDEIARKLADGAKGRSALEAREIGEQLFARYGESWGSLTVELGDAYPDRTYEVLREAAERTGSLSFPLIPQRLIEIAYLSTQRISTLAIIENNPRRLIYRIEHCKTYAAIRRAAGEDIAGAMTCGSGCLSLCRTVIRELRMEWVDIRMSASTAQDGFCEFVLEKTDAHRKA